LIEFGWQGSFDPSAYLSVPEAIRFLGSQVQSGWPTIFERNRALALAARKLLCNALEIDEPCPAESIAALATIPLPEAAKQQFPQLPFNESPLQNALRTRHKIEVPIIFWPGIPKRVLRISAQLYNFLPQYEQLAAALMNELRDVQ
jgi:isopenicillin-N epimerase